MIVEGAFFKLPELIFRYKYWASEKGVHEYTLHGSFVMALLSEINSRNIENPMRYIILEKPYPKGGGKRCDVYVEAPKVFQDIEGHMDKLGFKRKNYIEIKFFYDYKKRKHAKVTNAGKIINDLLRLKNYSKKDCGKYLLLTFNRSRENYLPSQRREGNSQRKKGKREYLEKLFRPGRNEISINLQSEVSSLKKEIDEAFREDKYDFMVTTIPIETIQEKDEKENYSFYLIRVDE